MSPPPREINADVKRSQTRDSTEKYLFIVSQMLRLRMNTYHQHASHIHATRGGGADGHTGIHTLLERCIGDMAISWN